MTLSHFICIQIFGVQNSVRNYILTCIVCLPFLGYFRLSRSCRAHRSQFLWRREWSDHRIPRNWICRNSLIRMKISSRCSIQCCQMNIRNRDFSVSRDLKDKLHFCYLILTRSHNIRHIHLAGKLSSWVHICAMEYRQLVTTCTYANLSWINAHQRTHVCYSSMTYNL